MTTATLEYYPFSVLIAFQDKPDASNTIARVRTFNGVLLGTLDTVDTEEGLLIRVAAFPNGDWATRFLTAYSGKPTHQIDRVTIHYRSVK